MKSHTCAMLADASGVVSYVEHHRTLGDWVALLAGAGFLITDLLEPEWPEDHDRVWGGWSAVRGRFTPGTAIFGADAGFPEIQGAFFGDVGRTWFFREEHRAVLGSYGVSFRWPIIPGLVLRLDWGRRWSDRGFRGYGLGPEQKRRSFVQFFFGYNY